MYLLQILRIRLLACLLQVRNALLGWLASGFAGPQNFDLQISLRRMRRSRHYETRQDDCPSLAIQSRLCSQKLRYRALLLLKGCESFGDGLPRSSLRLRWPSEVPSMQGATAFGPKAQPFI